MPFESCAHTAPNSILAEYAGPLWVTRKSRVLSLKEFLEFLWATAGPGNRWGLNWLMEKGSRPAERVKKAWWEGRGDGHDSPQAPCPRTVLLSSAWVTDAAQMSYGSCLVLETGPFKSPHTVVLALWDFHACFIFVDDLPSVPSPGPIFLLATSLLHPCHPHPAQCETSFPLLMVSFMVSWSTLNATRYMHIQEVLPSAPWHMTSLLQTLFIW